MNGKIIYAESEYIKIDDQYLSVRDIAFIAPSLWLDDNSDRTTVAYKGGNCADVKRSVDEVAALLGVR